MDQLERGASSDPEESRPCHSMPNMPGATGWQRQRKSNFTLFCTGKLSCAKMLWRMTDASDAWSQGCYLTWSML